MSLYSSMIAGVTGLQSNASALAAISDNIANLNTVGYKDNSVAFQDLVTNTGAGTYTAAGVSTVNQQDVTQQGTPTQTASPTDLAIAGQGMFVTAANPTAVGSTNPVLYTRAGSFTTDSSGNLVNSAGLYLLGWPANADGQISTTGSTSSLQPINVDTLAGAVSATTSASLTGNLDSSQAVSAAVTGGTYSATSATNSMTAYSSSGNTGVEPNFTMQAPISDSQGGQHTLQLDFLKSSTPNVWNVEVQTVPTSDINSGSGLPAGQIASGTVTFNPDGSFLSTTLPSSLTIGASSSTPTAGAASWASSLGVAGQTISLNLGGTNGSGGLTQDASTSTLTNVAANGTTFGTVSSVSVDKYGVVSATYSNGVTQPIAQVATATFANEDGLQAVSGDAYQATSASGAAALQTAGAGGAGTISSSSLESSTVDLSTEFTNLITAQSAYSASSKVITTADTMMQTLLQVIQG